MADITSDITIRDGREHSTGYIKCITPTTTAQGDTFDVDLNEYGSAGVQWVLGYVHSTNNSVVVTNGYTTGQVGTSNTLRMTIPSSGGTKKRCYLIGLNPAG